jgi:hypothetical protein
MKTWCIVLFAPLALLLACSRSAPPQQAPTLSPPDAVYKIRGQIVSVDSSGPDTIANVSHEAIPNFKTRDGAASAMPAMTMPFALGPAVDRSSLQPKSQWELTLEIRWEHAPGMLIAAVKPLPPGTTLTLER